LCIDIRALDPAVRPSTVFRAFDALEVGGSVEALNDHDPLGLRKFFEAARPGTFTWEYLQSGPDLWKVRVTRTAPPKVGEMDTKGLGCGCHG
jgi:uncharacterized protein (DUF2249 family)